MANMAAALQQPDQAGSKPEQVCRHPPRCIVIVLFVLLLGRDLGGSIALSNVPVLEDSAYACLICLQKYQVYVQQVTQ